MLRGTPRAINGKVFDTTVGAVVLIWKKSKTTLGITNLRWHDLRHEAASRFFEKTLHPMRVAAVTGHRSLNMLRRYTHLKAEDLAVMLG